MKTKIITITLLLTCLLPAQWSTSPLADDGLYVCWGFDPGIVTFDDGSSIVLGVLSDYICAQKLDPEGYRMWDDQVIVHYNPNSDMVADAWKNYWCCSDGDGGVIIFWLDKRDSYIQCGEPVCITYSNSLYIQRVDKNGNKMWGDDGILVSGADEGLKQARITPDGEGGCALLYSEERFVYPGADSINYLKIARYNKDGEQLWKAVLDSNLTQSQGYGVVNIYRCGRFYYSEFSRSGYHTILFRFDNNLILNKEIPDLAKAVSTNNKEIFFKDYKTYLNTYIVSKIDTSGDTLWTSNIYYGDKCQDAAGYLLPDNMGGTYNMWICNDSIMHFDSLGNFRYKYFEGIEIGGNVISQGTYYPDGNGGIIAANTSTVIRFNSEGKQVWSEPVTYLEDPLNAYSAIHKEDNNGGIIAVYWSTLGGIYAQHTGRYGDLGVVVGVDEPENDAPQDFALYQNYPNPFNPTTIIKYRTPLNSPLYQRGDTGGLVTLKIFNLLGQQVTTLINKQQSPGTFEVQWNAFNYPSGVYFYTLYINNKPLATKKLLIIK